MGPGAACVSTDPPGIEIESELFALGCGIVAGIDEVGRGAWAGPVSVGVVLVRPESLALFPEGIRDSKALRPKVREELLGPIERASLAWGVGHASCGECDALGMTAAQGLAARRAVAFAGVVPDAVIVDGRYDFTGLAGARAIVGADSSSLVVAAASVLAKVTRDWIMVERSRSFGGYCFERNKGYASFEHRQAVARLGLSDLHRRSWSVAGV